MMAVRGIKDDRSPRQDLGSGIQLYTSPHTTGSLLHRLERNEEAMARLNTRGRKTLRDKYRGKQQFANRREDIFPNDKKVSLSGFNCSPFQELCFQVAKSKSLVRTSSIKERGRAGTKNKKTVYIPLVETCEETSKVKKFREVAQKVWKMHEVRFRIMTSLNGYPLLCKVQTVIRVLRQFNRIAEERGRHNKLGICIAMQLKDTADETNAKSDLLFDPTAFQSHYKIRMPKWAKAVAQKDPEDRTESEIQMMAGLMRQLPSFRKYTKRMQYLMAKVSRFESFGRRRVVIRKGHIGTSFYVIFSGSVAVVIDGDEDMAFVEGEKATIVMSRGEAFGELALVRRSVRAATVVCLERSEFLVVDKENFFDAGIDKCVQEEMNTRVNFFRSLQLFSTLDEKAIKKMAEEARIHEYFNNKVVVHESMDSNYIYFVLKGECYVVRKLNPSLMAKSIRYQAAVNHWELRESTYGDDSSYDIYGISPVRRFDNIPQKETGLYHKWNQRCVPEPWKTRGINQREKDTGDEASVGKSVVSNISSSIEPSQTLDRKSNAPSEPHSKHADDNGKRICGSVVLLKVAKLEKGSSFGLVKVLEGNEKVDNKRSFALLSGGCEVLVVSQEAFKQILNEKTLAKILKNHNEFPSDEELYIAYLAQLKWRSYREKVVDEVVTGRSGKQGFTRTSLLNSKRGGKDRQRQKWARLVQNGLASPSQKISSVPKLANIRLNVQGEEQPISQNQLNSASSNRSTSISNRSGTKANVSQQSIQSLQTETCITVPLKLTERSFLRIMECNST